MRIRIGSYNCKNYFLTPTGEYLKPEKERRGIFTTIDRLDADILCMQEVENVSVLDEINQHLHRPYQYLCVPQSNSTRGINIGIMSHLSFKGTSHRNIILENQNNQPLMEYEDIEASSAKNLSPARFSRDLYLQTFKIGEKQLMIFNTHFKAPKNYSWLNHSAEKLRLAEAFATRKILDKYMRDPDNLVLLAGDLNQRHTHPSLRPLCQWSSLIDPIVKEIISSNKNAATFHSKKKERIDYLLLAKSTHAYYATGSAKIHDSVAARIASDHLPISIDLILEI